MGHEHADGNRPPESANRSAGSPPGPSGADRFDGADAVRASGNQDQPPIVQAVWDALDVNLAPDIRLVAARSARNYLDVAEYMAWNECNRDDMTWAQLGSLTGMDANDAQQRWVDLHERLERRWRSENP
jgi:hypothetical protein